MKNESSLSSNKKLVYRLMADQGPVSKAELLQTSSITSSTLTRLLDDMVAEKLIKGTALGTSSGGRRPILYEINPNYKYLFGLEISRFSSTLGLFDMAMNPKSTVRWRMDETFTPERLVEYTVRQMKLFLKDHSIDAEQILGVGITAVGPLDRHSRIILEPLYFPAKGWRNVAVCQLFEQETGWTSHLENGVNAALMGEIWAMRDKGIQHALYIHAGVSLRSSIMSHRRIVHGSVDTEGSIGQMNVQSDGPRLNASGNYGALEAYASIQALEKIAQAQAKTGRSLGSPLDQLSPEDLTEGGCSHYRCCAQCLEIYDGKSMNRCLRSLNSRTRVGESGCFSQINDSFKLLSNSKLSCGAPSGAFLTVETRTAVVVCIHFV